MKKLILILLLVFLLPVFGGFFLPSCGKTYAETPVTVDLEQLPQDARNAILDMQRRAKETQQEAEKPIEERMAKWLDLGRGIGAAIAEMGGALNMTANEFARSPVGLWGIAILTWKLLAKELLGFLLIAFVYLMLFLSFRHFHLNERVVTKKDGAKHVEYIPRYEFATRDGRGNSAAVHIVLFVVITIVAIIALV